MHKQAESLSLSLRNAVVGWLITTSVFQCGCRAITGRRPDRNLVEARQLSLQGVELLSRNQPQAAEECFSQAIAQSPADERAHWGISQTLWDSGRRTEAIKHMQEAVRLSGDNPEYLIRLGEMYLQQNQVSEAIQVSDKTLSRWHSNAAAWQLRGDTLARDRQWEAALQAYHRSLLIQPDNPPVQMSIAEIYRQMSRPHRALATLDRMVDHRPSMNVDGRMHLAKGQALADLGRQGEAIAAYQAAARYLPPQDIQQQLRLANALHQIGQQDDAKQTLANILRDHPEHVDANRLAGVLEMSYDHLATLPFEAVDPEAESIIR